VTTEKEGGEVGEIWRDVVGFEGLYEVSDGGRVRNVGTGRILKLKRDKYGYHCLSLRKDGRPYYFLAHRLVGLAFLGIPTGDLEINHKNGKTTDNRIENLEWVTHAENIKHGWDLLGCYRKKPTASMYARGVKHGRSKLTDEAVRQIRKLYQKGKGQVLADRFGVSISTIGRVVRGEAWAHVE